MPIFILFPLFMIAIRILIRQHFLVIIQFAFRLFRLLHKYCMSTSHTAMM